MLRSAWFRWIAVISALFVVVVVAFKFSLEKKTTIKAVDSCVVCHSNIKTIGKSHPISVFGCATCHGGNRYATDKNVAHKGMVKNPARLEYASKYCAKCHSDVIDRVEKSIMATNKGIIGVLNKKYLGIDSYPSIEEIKELKTDNLTVNYFRKMCAACHINQLQSIFSKQKVRGGGCVDCHGVKEKNNPHTILTTRIPSSNCLKCHNRSNRIGLAYFGQFQSAGYGTPYKHGEFSHVIKGGGRYYLKLHADIHWQKAHLECIDCHTEHGIMGDGYEHKRFEDQVVIQCEDCHSPQFGKPNELAKLLAQTNAKIPLRDGLEIAYTHKDFRPIYNLQKDKNGKILFYRKLDGKPMEMKLMSNKPYHTLDIHKKLSCQACHSEWMPSCYGCHVANFKNKKQFDWLLHKPTKGAFREFSSFNRFSHPTLGVGWKGKIMPFAPGCQSFVTVYSNGIKPEKQFYRLFFASWDPHTTQLKSRSCTDCHFNPTTLGLGRGSLHIKDNKIIFSPVYNSRLSGLPIDFPLDAFVNIEGKQLQGVSIKTERAFNKKEINSIVSAYSCILCHGSYSDKVYKDFKKSKRLFLEGKTPCSK